MELQCGAALRDLPESADPATAACLGGQSSDRTTAAQRIQHIAQDIATNLKPHINKIQSQGSVSVKIYLDCLLCHSAFV